jgi:ribosome-associated protein
LNKEALIKELQFKAVRSSGAGGQHVNKVSSKIELAFNVSSSLDLTEPEKEKIYLKLASRLTKENVLLLQCDESRSQHKNKELVIKRFLHLIENALKVSKKRKRTKPSKSSIEKRLKSKKKAAEKKLNRNKPKWN